MRNIGLALVIVVGVVACNPPKHELVGGDAGANRGPNNGPPAERCGNGIDDDGDGKIDEGCPCAGGATQKCYGGAARTRGVGACHDGLQTCALAAGSSTAAWGDCTGDQQPMPELCGDDG